MESDEFRCVMLEAVNNLPPSQRESVMMYYYEQLTTREIAEALSVSENTVKSRLRYARNGIRENRNRKKSRTATVKIIGKAKGMGITLKNTKYAKMVYNKKLSAVTVKGLKKGNTTLTITVNGKKLRLKTKVK